MKRIISVMMAVATATVLSMAEPLKVGDDAPNFEMKGSDGKTYKLSDFKGKKPVVIAWYPKAFTGGCTKECKALAEQGDEIRKFDVAYFTASVDQKVNTENHGKDIAAKLKELNFPAKK